MAKSWSGFIPHNLSAREDWALLEGCQTEIRKKEELLETEPKSRSGTDKSKRTEREFQYSR